MAKKRSSKKVSPHHSTAPGAQRLNKILASAGLGSRRKVEDLIEQGRVQIDGDVVTDLACKVDPVAVKIKVDGEFLKKSRPVYFALNKPPGVLSTNYDPSGRMRVIDLVPDRDRVFSVGRLDQSSEGLMLLTNDGELAQRLAHPKFRIQKTYFVVVSGQMSEDELNKLRKGVHLAEGLARIDGAAIKRVRKGCTELEIILSEGKNREIRRILARAGHKVVLLRRIAIGPLRLGQMPVGASRPLTSNEVKALYVATTEKPRPKTKSQPADTKPAVKKGTVQARKSVLEKPRVEEDDEDDLLSLSMADGLGPMFDDDDFPEIKFPEPNLAELNFAEQDFVDDGLVDDDFVGDFSGTGNVGRVLDFDDDGSSTADKPPVRRGRLKVKTTRQTTQASGSRTTTRKSKANTYAKTTGKPRAASGSATASGPRTGSSRAAPARGSQSRAAAAGPGSTPRSGGPKRSTARIKPAGGKPTGGKPTGGKPTGGKPAGRRSSGRPSGKQGKR
jgi:23S rRNA pseudouridine2605 synthase